MLTRTRFAPSPTGDLHIGSARTALYCWLYARQTKGKFILRIEDTDRERSTDAAVQVILSGLNWLGIDWDEGPFYQSTNFARYTEVAQQLIANGHAYKCYCSTARLDKLRAEQNARNIKPRYDGHCRELHEDLQQPFVLRFKNPQDGVVVFDDLIRGKISIANQELDDLVLLRTDGTPTYNFTVVVDDVDMKITTVIRGEDHINNTPRQINILKALGAAVPQYAHVAMILGADGKKLSKRHGSVSVLQYREDGFLPEALLNYLVRLGWSHGDQEIFSIAEMQQLFTLDKVNNSAAIIDPKKLTWLNQHYLKTLSIAKITKHVEWHFTQLSIDVKVGPALDLVIAALRARVKTVKELAEKARIFYEETLDTSIDMLKQHNCINVTAPLTKLNQALTTLDIWQAENIHTVLTQIVEEFQLKFIDLAQPLRIILLANTISPPLDITLELLGKQKVLLKLNTFLQTTSLLIT